MNTDLRAMYLFFFCVMIFAFSAHEAKAGDFGEHKRIGDDAFRQYCQTNPRLTTLLKELLNSEPLDINSNLIPLTNNNVNQFYGHDRYAGQYPLLILGDRAVTYGDLTALSGDHSPDFFELYRLFINDHTFSPTGLFESLFKNVLHQYSNELANLNNGGRGYNPVFLEFIFLAARDKSHFHIPATPLRQEIDIIGESAYNQAYNLLYSGLAGDAFAAKNRQKALAFFEANSVAKYSILHTMAKSYYVHVFEAIADREKNLQLAFSQPAISKASLAFLAEAEKAKERAKKFLLITLFTNAFSEHYLQDMFAAGHFFADRNASDFLGLEAKGIHDFFGRHGLQTSVQGKPLTLKGDGRYTDDQMALAVQANIASLKDLFAMVTSNPHPEYDYLQLLHSPTQDPVSVFPAFKLIPAIPLGKNFFDQRKSIGRSLNGLNYGMYALASRGMSGAGITTGVNYLIKNASKATSPIETKAGLGFNAFFEAGSQKMTESSTQWRGRFGIGVNLILFDWVYASSAVITGLPVAVTGKFEQGIQIKRLPWKYGIHVGVVEYTAGYTPAPIFTIGVIKY